MEGILGILVVRRPPWGHRAARVIEFAFNLEVLIWWLDGFQSFPVLYAAVL